MSSIEELFAEGRKALLRAHKDPVAPPALPSSLFSSEENWRRGQGIALVHRATQTLLGNFWEYHHRTVPGARRLVRATEPIAVRGLEEVDYGYSPTITTPAPSLSLPVSQHELHVALVQLGTPALLAESVSLTIHRQGGVTCKVTLDQSTSFSAGEEILQLPAGLDLLPVLSRETRITIHQALK